MVIEGTSDVVISGNVFSSVRPKALSIEGQPSERILFTDNVLTDVESDHTKLGASSLVENNIESAK